MKNLLSLFGLRPLEINLYQTLFAEEAMSASNLAKKAGISRTSAYDLLNRLIEAGLVTETQKAGVKLFSVLPPEKIQLLLSEKQKELSQAEKALQNLQQLYAGQRKSLTPRLQLFEGQRELQQMMKDLLLYRDITIKAYWPAKTMVKLLTPEFLTAFHQERIERNIMIKAIWPQKQIPEIKNFRFYQPGPENKRQVRIAPADVDFSLGYIIYGQTVRFLSSSKEDFGFLVESQELAAMMKSQFKIIWELSKPFK